MIDTIFLTPQEVSQCLAVRAKEKRLSLNWSQATLASRSNVSLAVLKKFETTGQISLISLLKLAQALGDLPQFASMFAPKPPETFATLDELLKQKTRQRGRS